MKPTTSPTAAMTLPPLPVYPDYLTATEAGEILHVSGRQVGVYVREGGLHASRVGKRLLIRRDAVNAFIESSRTS